MLTMRHHFHGRTLITVHTAEPPTDPEWDAVLQDFQDRKPERVLVFTEGGGPATLQRGRLNDALGGKPLTTAIVSSSPVVRGIVTALSWFNPDMRVFHPDRARAALEYLGIASEQHAACMGRVQKLATSLRDGGLRCVVWSEGRGE